MFVSAAVKRSDPCSSSTGSEAPQQSGCGKSCISIILYILTSFYNQLLLCTDTPATEVVSTEGRDDQTNSSTVSMGIEPRAAGRLL